MSVSIFGGDDNEEESWNYAGGLEFDRHAPPREPDTPKEDQRMSRKSKKPRKEKKPDPNTRPLFTISWCADDLVSAARDQGIDLTHAKARKLLKGIDDDTALNFISDVTQDLADLLL